MTPKPIARPTRVPTAAAPRPVALALQGSWHELQQFMLAIDDKAGFGLLLNQFRQGRSDEFDALGRMLYDDFSQGKEQSCNTLEFLWINLLQQANNARDVRLVPVFSRLARALLAQDAQQNVSQYGLFHTNQSPGLAFPAWLPIHRLHELHPAASELYGPADLSLLGLIHDLSMANRVQQGKYGLKAGKGEQPWQIQAEPDPARCVEIEINYHQILSHLDSHWNATSSLAVMDFIKYFARHGLTIMPFHKHTFSPAPQYSDAAFYLTQHTRGVVSPNRWHFKHAHISRHMQVDRYGYAGFSQLAEEGIFRHGQGLSPQSDAETAAWVNRLRSGYASGALPKVAQLDCTLPGTAHYERIIFAPLQIASDQVMQLAWINNQDMIRCCLRHQRTRDLLIIKKHPWDDSAETTQFLADLETQAGVLITTGSIYSLFKLADVVLTCNSGTGFEALLFGKPVISCGRSDYRMATATATDENRLAALLNGDGAAMPDEAARNRFVMNYCREMYCVDRSIDEKEQWLRTTFPL